MCVYVHKMADPKAKGSGHNYTGQTIDSIFFFFFQHQLTSSHATFSLTIDHIGKHYKKSTCINLKNITPPL